MVGVAIEYNVVKVTALLMVPIYHREMFAGPLEPHHLWKAVLNNISHS